MPIDLFNYQMQVATDLIYRTVDDLLSDGRFAECNDWLADINVEIWPLMLLRTALVATYPAKELLPARPTLFSKAWDAYVAVKGKEKTERLLGRLV